MSFKVLEFGATWQVLRGLKEAGQGWGMVGVVLGSWSCAVSWEGLLISYFVTYCHAGYLGFLSWFFPL